MPVDSAAAIPEAVRKLATQFNLSATVPEVVKQLAAGAISAPKPPADDEDLEDDLEVDEEETDA
jgi:hypothetical protein